MPTTETIDALNRSADETQKLRAKLRKACAWKAIWKRAAKNQRAWRHTVAEIAAKQIMEHAHCQEQRDEALRLLREAREAARLVEGVDGE